MTMPQQNRNTSKQDYSTPAEFIAAATRRLRITRFNFDFAADASNHKARRYWDKETDALTKTAEQWAAQVAGGWGWLNPEFKDIAPWARKCAEAEDAGAHIAFLVPAGVGANWFSDYVHHRALVLALNGRLCFIEDWRTTINPATLKPGKGPPRFFESEPLNPKDCMLCLFEPTISPGFDVWCWK